MPQSKTKSGNFISEWFGYRVYPTVSNDPGMTEVQARRECPFLSASIGESRECIKSESSKGVCTICTVTGDRRDEWLVCPYRGLERGLLEPATRQLFAVEASRDVLIASAPSLQKEEVRSSIIKALKEGRRAFVFFQDKLGGEISLPKTDRSPELSFDITLVEISGKDEAFSMGQYGILEIQTMDFHGTYRRAVDNLTHALRLHRNEFPAEVATHSEWLSDHVEGPNLANVFKRTFYQMVFKFQMGLDKSCAGCVLAVSSSVWASWQRHLGKPDLRPNADGTLSLVKPQPASPPPTGPEVPESKNLERRQPTGELSAPAWIYVFDMDASSGISPNKIELRKTILTDAHSFAYYALDVAPSAAVASAVDVIRASVLRRLARLWPVFGTG
jgi:hypothetical protein